MKSAEVTRWHSAGPDLTQLAKLKFLVVWKTGKLLKYYWAQSTHALSTYNPQKVYILVKGMRAITSAQNHYYVLWIKCCGISMALERKKIVWLAPILYLYGMHPLPSWLPQISQPPEGIPESPNSLPLEPLLLHCLHLSQDTHFTSLFM